MALPADGLGVYVHIPFCRKKCTYCAFVTRGVHASRVVPFLAALHREIDLIAPLAEARRVDTVFLGGGTPTVLQPAELTDLLAHLRRAFAIAPDAEITCEANPEGVTPERAEALLAAGVTRLSVGAQSAIASELRAVHRTHDLTAVAEAVTVARRAGFRDLNLDLLFGLPGQTPATWRASLDALSALAPDHLSFYGLSVEPGTVLARQAARGAVLPGDDAQADMYAGAVRALGKAGWDHYEISNAARPGHRSRHNLGYWRRTEYLGLGPGAHGFLAEERTVNEADLGAYGARLQGGVRPLVSRDAVTEEERVAETVVLALRLADGLDLDAASRRLGVPLKEVYAGVLRGHLTSGALALDGSVLTVPERFWFVAHEVLADFLEPDLTGGRRAIQSAA